MLLLLSEEIWFLPTWWIWFGTGAIPHMAAEQTAYQRCLSVPTLYWKVSTIKHVPQKILNDHEPVNMGLRLKCVPMAVP